MLRDPRLQKLVVKKLINLVLAMSLLVLGVNLKFSLSMNLSPRLICFFNCELHGRLEGTFDSMLGVQNTPEGPRRAADSPNLSKSRTKVL